MRRRLSGTDLFLARSAELRQVARDFRDDRDRLVLSSATLPGSSGGPVLNRRGRAVGVVERENVREQLGQITIRAYTATPTRYLAELREPALRA
jgi:S1-C subfamily serine protease